MSHHVLGVAVCEAYALFEKWCPEKMLYTDSDNRRKRIGGVGNNDMRTAEVFRDARRTLQRRLQQKDTANWKKCILLN